MDSMIIWLYSADVVNIYYLQYFGGYQETSIKYA